MEDNLKLTFKLNQSTELMDNIENLLIISLGKILEVKESFITYAEYDKRKNINIDRMINLLESIKIKEEE